MEVLEYNYYLTHSDNDEYLPYINQIPTSIKFLSYQIIDEITKFEIDLITQLVNLEYLYIAESTGLQNIEELLDRLPETNIKYIYISRIFIDDDDDDDMDIGFIINKLSKYKIMIGEFKSTREIDFDTYNKNYELRKSKGYIFYTFKNQLTPNQWLVQHGHMLRPECQN